MSRFHDAAVRLAAATADEVAALWQRHVAGSLSERQLIALAARAIAGANRRAVTVADLGIATQVIEQLRRPVPMLGLVATERDLDQTRLADAVGVVLVEEVESAGSPDALASSRENRLIRLARDEPLKVLATAAGVAMVERGVEGWVRETDANPCKLCTGWADGVVRSPAVPMNRHTGCSCVPRTVITLNTHTAGV